MKYMIVATFFLLSCTNSVSNALSESDVIDIKNEIDGEIEALIDGCRALDMERIFKVFSRDAGFYMIAGDGKPYNYEQFYANNKNYFDELSAFEINTIRKDISVLSRDYVVVTWIYNVTATGKEGWQDVLESAGAMFVFKKIADEWKVINYQESSAPPQRIEKISLDTSNAGD